MKVIYTEEFKRDVRKVKDKKVQDRIRKMVKKIKENHALRKFRILHGHGHGGNIVGHQHLGGQLVASNLD